MASCPACVSMPLANYEASPGVTVELCSQCRGLFLDRSEIRTMVGRGSLGKATEVVPVSLGEEVGMQCPSCIEPAMQPLQMRDSSAGGLWQCRTCGGMWLGEGTFFELARALRTQLPAIGGGVGPLTATAPGLPRLAHSRSRFDEGVENLIALPLVLVLSWLFCATSFGRLIASLVGMPFHEVGHAAASWLSSRIAIPLPFFTFWYDDQSILMGLLVAGVLSWVMYHTYREKNWFALGTAGVLLLAQAVITLAIAPWRTLMWQIVSGALGELVFGAFLLVAFHFPLPDRFRWDFWRWVALFPAALCFMHAIKLWRTVSADVSQMPWGSALGNDSDGDMNRLVQQFGWDANALADFYLRVGYLCLAAMAVAYAYALWRHHKTRG